MVYILEWAALQQIGTYNKEQDTVTLDIEQLVELLSLTNDSQLIKDLTMYKIYMETNNCKLIIEK